MEFLIFTAAFVGVSFTIIAIHEIATEVRGIRGVFESHYQLERVRIQENQYKRKGVEL
jgi:hypothetical protein